MRAITDRLRATDGDPFLVRGVLGQIVSKKKGACSLDSEDETEFIEVLVSTKSTLEGSDI